MRENTRVGRKTPNKNLQNLRPYTYLRGYGKTVFHQLIIFYSLGDERVNEVPSLGGLHVVFLRLHNIIAKQIRYFSKMSSPNVFLETKKIVGALLQQITYGEYLPLILSKKTRKSLDLDLKPWGYWKKYDGNVNPTVKNVVATAALRFGHSQVL